MAHPPCCTKLGLLFSASTSRAREMQPLMPLSQVQVQGVHVARQENQHRWQNPDLKMNVYQMSLHSCLCQQFFLVTSLRPWRKSLVSITYPWWTPDSLVNQKLRTTDRVAVQGPGVWVAFLESRVAKTMISWVNQRQHANCHRLHKSDDQCCCRCAILFKVSAWSHVERPLCWECLCASKLGLILDRMTVLTSGWLKLHSGHLHSLRF